MPNSMSLHYLQPLFAPKSIALVGASERTGALGNMVFDNLTRAGFSGKLHLVNPRHGKLFGRSCVGSLHDIDEQIDLAVITAPARVIPDVLKEGARRGLKSAAILSAGFAETGAEGRKGLRQVLAIARRHGIRLLGPGGLGLMRPSLGLNTTYAATQARSGNIALVSQSAAICSAILDWAYPAGIGFSSVISLGAGADVDFGEILDYLVFDQETAHILLYIEGIRDARRFMSSLRAAARTKPIVVLKAGRFDAGSKAAASHTGVLTASDAVFAAALKRSGTVRVRTYTQLFAAARILASERSAQGNRLAIVTNGGGPGVMAADAATENGVALAGLSAITRKRLDAVLPANWSHGNPIDIIGDATCERFVETLKAVVEDPDVDGILTLFCPQRMTRAKDAARAIVPIGQESAKPFLTAWLGEAEVAECRPLFESAGIPNFYTPENAVEAFSFLAAFRRNQMLLLETAPPHSILPPLPPADIAIANSLREKLVAEGRTVMTELESKMLLRSFHISVPVHIIATSKEAALEAATCIGYPVVIKVQSHDIAHKSDVGGVRLNLQNKRMLEAAYDDMLAQIRDIQPKARIEGVAVQPMLRYSHAREVLVGLSTDPVFGPVVLFGLGGVAVEALGDIAVALPPLNRRLAAELIEETHIVRLLKSYHGFNPVDFDALETLLLQVSSLACQLPWVKEMDLNPVLAHPEGVMVADARIVIDPARESGVKRYRHMAIHPYPAELESTLTLKGHERLRIRPIKPEDAQMEQAFVSTLSDNSRYMRFLHHLAELSPIMLARFTQIDYDREMALIALAEIEGKQAIVGVARYHPNPDRVSAEFAVTVTDGWQGRGLGHMLMQKLLECARDAGYDSLVGTVLSLNSPMLQMARRLGFETMPLDGGQTLRIWKSLT